MMNLDIVINYAVSVFEKVLNVEIQGWNYFNVNDDEIDESLNVFASFSQEDNAIFLNPYIDKICGKYGKEFMVATIISKIAHEMRHVWQIKYHYKEYEWDEYKSYGNIGDDYINNKAEIDAFAFEEAVLKVLFDNPKQELDIPSREVHVLGNRLHNRYKKIIEIALESR